MWLSDTSVKRPVFAAVINLLIIAFGIVAFTKLPLRQYPEVEAAAISIMTYYPGASASVVETKVTEPIESLIAGVEGVKTISSTSENGLSNISVEFEIDRNIDSAANDLRDALSRVNQDLPEDAEAPLLQKSGSNEEVIIWVSLTNPNMDNAELGDYARRYLKDKFTSVNGVVRVIVAGSPQKAMRIWLNPAELAARNLTVNDIEQALRTENIELPAGAIESINKDFTVQLKRTFYTPEDFEQLIIAKGENNYIVRLKDVATVEITASEKRNVLRSNGEPTIGLGMVKQSQANALEVADRIKTTIKEVKQSLPKDMIMDVAYDRSMFIEASINEVYKTLFIALILVVMVIYAFLGNVRAMLIPAITVPVSLIGTFTVLYALGFTMNLLTLLAMVLAIGLVVDDTIVVIENIHRRTEMGEPRLLAAFRGAGQVGFAVIATTLVLVFVFLPITFMEGMTGKLFTEFSVTIAAAVIFSSIVALSLSPMLASKYMTEGAQNNKFTLWLDKQFNRLKSAYTKSLQFTLKKPLLSISLTLAMLAGAIGLFKLLPSEFTPTEDQGAFFFMIQGPEGSSYNYVTNHINEIEKRLMPFVESGEFHQLLIRAPGSFGATENYSNGIGIVVLEHWDTGRKPIQYYVGKVHELTSDIPGVFVFPIVPQSFNRGDSKPVQFVLGGSTYEELAQWRDILLDKVKDNPNLPGIDSDYKETRPQISIQVNKDRAADLGVSILSINQTLQTMLGSKKVTTYIDRGLEYDVIIESDKAFKQSTNDISNLYVRSTTTGKLIPLANLVTVEEFADASSLNRYNRLRSITLSANLADGYKLADGLDYLENLARTELPEGVNINYKGQSLKYKDSSRSIYFVFALALFVVFLVLAGLFESFIHPFIIMLTVPLAITGALLGLWVTGQTLNIYSQIGLIILVGLAAKNGILIVEFINQRRDEGVSFNEAIIDASSKRLRPIIMTGLTTAMGAVPLVLSFGAGAENRFVIGTVILSGVLLSTIFTLYVVPAIYHLLAKKTTSPKATAKALEAMLNG